jgi:hypothetical protein
MFYGLLHVAEVCSKSYLDLYAPSLKQQYGILNTDFSDEGLAEFFSKLSVAEKAIKTADKNTTTERSASQTHRNKHMDPSTATKPTSIKPAATKPTTAEPAAKTPSTDTTRQIQVNKSRAGVSNEEGGVVKHPGLLKSQGFDNGAEQQEAHGSGKAVSRKQLGRGTIAPYRSSAKSGGVNTGKGEGKTAPIASKEPTTAM